MCHRPLFARQDMQASGIYGGSMNTHVAGMLQFRDDNRRQWRRFRRNVADHRLSTVGREIICQHETMKQLCVLSDQLATSADQQLLECCLGGLFTPCSLDICRRLNRLPGGRHNIPHFESKLRRLKWRVRFSGVEAWQQLKPGRWQMLFISTQATLLRLR